jgi:hypothetical protein
VLKPFCSEDSNVRIALVIGKDDDYVWKGPVLPMAFRQQQ